MRETLSVTAKYRKMRKITDGIVSICSETCDSLYQSRLLLLMGLYDKWREGVEVTIAAVKSERTDAVGIEEELAGGLSTNEHGEHDQLVTVSQTSKLFNSEQVSNCGQSAGVKDTGIPIKELIRAASVDIVKVIEGDHCYHNGYTEKILVSGTEFSSKDASNADKTLYLEEQKDKSRAPISSSAVTADDNVSQCQKLVGVVDDDAIGSQNLLVAHSTKRQKSQKIILLPDMEMPELFSCELCGSVYRDLNYLLQHIETHAREATVNDDDPEAFRCSKCDRTFAEKRYLGLHMLSHDREKRVFLCDKCPRSFATSVELNRHLLNHCGVNRTHKCDQCDKTFVHRNYLEQHKTSAHSDERPFRCPYCPKAFALSAGLNLHVKNHLLDRPFKCPHCDKSFTRATKLREHVVVHTDSRPFLCQYCEKSFFYSGNLRSHIKTHFPDQFNVHRCEHCAKTFLTARNLQRHVLSHTGEKPFLCTVCSKKFSQEAHLTLHMKIHTGDRPYKCTDCEKGFRTSSELKAHSVVHSTEKPFACDVCGKRYRRKQMLKVHKCREKSGRRRKSRSLAVTARAEHDKTAKSVQVSDYSEEVIIVR